MTDHDLSAVRESYARGGLSEDDLAPTPMAMFERWYDAAAAAGVHEPNAMLVATATPDGVPSARFVLLKEFDDQGFVFYTNLGSRKGREIAANPRVALVFPWHPLERQVRVEGPVEELDRSAVDAYFGVRPRGSQLGAWASHQSREVADRDEVDAAYVEAERRFEGGEVPTPEEWGGYRVRPETVEFWQGRIGRMHDRLVYRRCADEGAGEGAGEGGGWTTHRLAP